MVKIIKNKYLQDLQDKIADTKTEETQIIEYLSNFDFEANEFTEAEKRYIQEREKILVVECKKNRDSLYNICMTLSEISDFFKNNKERKFMAWYEAAGFSKDMISVYLKRADLYIKFEDKKDLISALSNQAIKILTNQLVTSEQQKEVLALGYTAVEDIRNNLSNDDDDKKQLIEVPTKFKYFNTRQIDKINKDIKKMSSKDVSEAKKEINYFKKLLVEAEKQINLKEKEFENQNNLKLVGDEIE